jgi:hypothetical protein
MNKIIETLKTLDSTARTILIGAIALGAYFAVADFSQSSKLAKTKQEYVDFKKSADSSLAFVKIELAKTVAENKKTADSALAQAEVYRKKAAALEKTRPSLDSTKKLITQIDSLKAAAHDSVELARTVIPAQDSVIKKQNTDIAWFEQRHVADTGQIVNLRIALKADTVTINKQADGLKRLQESLAKVPVPESDKILGFIPAPSRKAAFVVGGILGAGATVYLLKK